jgi:hypothetical protein
VKRVKRLSAVLTAVLLLAAGCGGEEGSGDDSPKEAASSTRASDASSSSDAGSSAVPSESESSPADAPSDTALTDEATPNPTRVEEIAGILGCDFGAGRKAPEGDTEYPCGEFLIVDWGTAGVTEEQMWENVDSWVDEQRPSYIPADQFVLVYGTAEALEPHSEQLLGRE